MAQDQNPAVETAIEALRIAIDAALVQAGVQAVEDYKAQQPAQPATNADQGETPAPTTGSDAGTPSEPSEPAATAIYTQDQYDQAIDAQKQADQAKLEAMTANYDAANKRVTQLQDDVKVLKADFDKLEQDAQ